MKTNNMALQADKYRKKEMMMEEMALNIPNISCGHCVMAIKNELSEIKGVSGITGNPETKTIVVKWESPATSEQIKAALKEINYPSAS